MTLMEMYESLIESGISQERALEVCEFVKSQQKDAHNIRLLQCMVGFNIGTTVVFTGVMCAAIAYLVSLQ